VITAFMAGLAAGSWCVQRWLPHAGMRMFAGIQLAAAVACLLLPLLFVGMRESDWSAGWMQTTFSLLAFSLAVLFGMEFAVASTIRGGAVDSSVRGGAVDSSVRGGAVAATASDLYGLDLAGSALGALMISVYAIPMFGVSTVSRLLGLASAGAAAFCLITRRS